jgi:hypothetical protein
MLVKRLDEGTNAKLRITSKAKTKDNFKRTL